VRIRKALLVTTGERYAGLASNFIMTVVVSRLLTPDEVGIWAIGLAAAMLVMSVREFAPATYLVQKVSMSREDMRAAFTVMLTLSALIAATLALIAPWLAEFYGEPSLMAYLRVAAIAVVIDAVPFTFTALMRRELAFAQAAIASVVGSATFGATAIALAALGFSYMSFAWAWVLSTLLSAIVCLYYRPDFWLFVPLFRNAREILTFGGYNGVNVFLYKLYESVPAMILGRAVSANAVGLFSRAQLVCQLPDKVLLGGVIPVILPALASEFRAGRNLKEPYLRAVSLITAVQWPVLVVLAILAHTIVHILLGDQWLGVVVPVQIMALSLVFSSTNELNYPVLVSVGAMRDVVLRGLIAWPISALIIACASLFGLIPAMLSFFLIVPFQAFIAIYFVRRHVPIAWMDLVHATWRSAIIAACSGAGPLLIVALRGFHFDLSTPEGILAGVAAGIGWLAGIWLTDHAALGELHLAGNALKRYWYGSAQQA